MHIIKVPKKLKYFLFNDCQRQPNNAIGRPLLKVRQSRKQIMVSSILPKNERWDDFSYIKLSQHLFFERIEDIIICFRDCLTFSRGLPMALLAVFDNR